MSNKAVPGIVKVLEPECVYLINGRLLVYRGIYKAMGTGKVYFRFERSDGVSAEYMERELIEALGVGHD